MFLLPNSVDHFSLYLWGNGHTFLGPGSGPRDRTGNHTGSCLIPSPAWSTDSLGGVRACIQGSVTPHQGLLFPSILTWLSPAHLPDSVFACRDSFQQVPILPLFCGDPSPFIPLDPSMKLRIPSKAPDYFLWSSQAPGKLPVTCNHVTTSLHVSWQLSDLCMDLREGLGGSIA